jgi:hypothetical protein
MLEEFQESFGGEPNVFDDFAEKIWRDIPASVKRNGRHAAVSVAKLFVRSALTNLYEAKVHQNTDDLPRLEDG